MLTAPDNRLTRVQWLVELGNDSICKYIFTGLPGRVIQALECAGNVVPLEDGVT
jgi:hypothetical protein